MSGLAKTHLVIVRTDDEGNHHVSGGNVKEFTPALEGDLRKSDAVKEATQRLVDTASFKDLAGGKRSNALRSKARRTRSRARRTKSKVGGKRSRARRTKSKRSKSTRR